MQIRNVSSYAYSKSARPSFTNHNFAVAKDPIGATLTSKSIIQKSDSLKEILSGVDLRNITADQLAKLGASLYKAGEISDVAVSNFVVGTGDMSNRDEKFDAIAFFEDKLKIATTDRSLKGSEQLYSDTLYTVYNIDRVIRAGKGEGLINVFA